MSGCGMRSKVQHEIKSAEKQVAEGFQEDGMSRTMMKIRTLMILVSMLAMNVFSVWGDEPVGIIHGRVFIDENGNGLFDPDEAVMEGVEIEITNGEIIVSALTDEYGTFSFNVEPGVWQGIIYVPEGYTVINDATREAVIDSGEPYEAMMDFALVLTEASAEEELVVDGGGDVNSSEAGVDSSHPTDYFEGGSDAIAEDASNASSGQGSDSGILGVILPESGFPIPLRLAAAIILVVVLVAGTTLIFLGRRLTR